MLYNLVYVLLCYCSLRHSRSVCHLLSWRLLMLISPVSLLFLTRFFLCCNRLSWRFQCSSSYDLLSDSHHCRILQNVTRILAVCTKYVTLGREFLKQMIYFLLVIDPRSPTRKYGLTFSFIEVNDYLLINDLF